MVHFNVPAVDMQPKSEKPMISVIAVFLMCKTMWKKQ